MTTNETKAANQVQQEVRAWLASRSAEWLQSAAENEGARARHSIEGRSNEHTVYYFARESFRYAAAFLAKANPIAVRDIVQNTRNGQTYEIVRLNEAKQTAQAHRVRVDAAGQVFYLDNTRPTTIRLTCYRPFMSAAFLAATSAQADTCDCGCGSAQQHQEMSDAE